MQALKRAPLFGDGPQSTWARLYHACGSVCRYFNARFSTSNCGNLFCLRLWLRACKMGRELCCLIEHQCSWCRSLYSNSIKTPWPVSMQTTCKKCKRVYGNWVLGLIGWSALQHHSQCNSQCSCSNRRRQEFRDGLRSLCPHSNPCNRSSRNRMRIFRCCRCLPHRKLYQHHSLSILPIKPCHNKRRVSSCKGDGNKRLGVEVCHLQGTSLQCRRGDRVWDMAQQQQEQQQGHHRRGQQWCHPRQLRD